MNQVADIQLEQLRSGTLGFRFEDTLRRLRLSTDVMISEEELVKLRTLNYRPLALQTLGFLRQHPSYEKIQHLLELLQIGGLTLDDIGIDEMELERLLAKEYENKARKWLCCLRETEIDCASVLLYSRLLGEDLKKAGLTLKDILFI